MATYFTSRIETVGSDAAPLCEAGIFILFSPPLPDTLGDVSIAHITERELQEFGVSVFVQPGDTLTLGDLHLRVDAVGSEAMSNFATLGHVVLHVDPEPDHNLLPGAIRCNLISGDLRTPETGTQITFSK